MVVSVTILLLLLSSCDVSDDRDLCCDRVTIYYRYVRRSLDEYLTHIGSERRFLFDGEGLFLRELPVDPALRQRVSLMALPAGRYTIIAVGNPTSESTSIPPLTPGVSRLEDMRVGLHPREEGGRSCLPADELFWSRFAFEVIPSHPAKYIADMSNVHCHLHVAVTWETHPPQGERRMGVRLSGLVGAYGSEEDPAQRIYIVGQPPTEDPSGWISSRTFVYHAFPRGLDAPQVEVERTVSLWGEELYAELITLRYQSDRLPTLQLLHEGLPLFHKPIDLAPLFARWGWSPSRQAEQVYRISVHVLSDSKVLVRTQVRSEVLDWADGGSFAI